MNTISELTELIDIYAGTVGLRRCPLPVVACGEGDRGIRWEAQYAQLVLWRVQSTGRAEIRAEVERVQEKLDTLLVIAETQLSGVVDGYLLLLLGSEPDEELHTLIRSLELNTNVCRKSFIWPKGGETPEARWGRLWRTTVIGLPESPPPVGMVGMPQLTEPCKGIWREIRRFGSANAARKALKECRRW
jgi:hypothetical protein